MKTSDRKVGRVTLLDVAEAASASRATASLVIRKSPPVADETRRRVEQAIARLDYVYNMGAAGMRATRSNTLGVIIPNLVRHESREVTKGLLAMFDGRVRHHVFDLAHDEAGNA